MGYKEFVKFIEEVLKNQDNAIETGCLIFRNYFEKPKFSTYIHMHTLFLSDDESLDNISKLFSNKSMDVLSCLKERTRICVEKLVADYNERLSEKEKIFSYNPELDPQYQVVRRITKFEENIISVENALETKRQSLLQLNQIDNNYTADVSAAIERYAKRLQKERDIAVRLLTKATKDAENLKKDVWTNIIAIFSIFSAVVFSLMTSANLVSNIAASIASRRPPYPDYVFPAFMILLVSICCFNLIYFALIYINRIVNGNKNRIGKKYRESERKNNFFWVFVTVNSIMVLLIIILFIRVYILPY